MNTRWVAARIIAKILQDGVTLTAGLDNALKSIVSTQDKALIQAICYGVCRYYHRLDFILNSLIDKPIKSAEVKALLMVGLYQLNYMRVKPHAAVSETVYAAKTLSWAKPIINAVLRNYLRNKENIEKQAELSKIAAVSHPNWLITLIEEDWPQQAETILQENNRPPPMTLRVNAMKTDRDSYLNLLAERNIPGHPIQGCSAAITLDKPVSVEALPNFAGGWVSVQDSAAQMAALLLNVQPGHRVLDVCAAPGGKTAHILELHPKVGELIALDIDKDRMRRVTDNLVRLGLQATCIVADANQPETWWDGKPFDRILLDAPCSATGVIRRHPDIKLLRQPEAITAIIATQKSILNAVWPLLASDGMLLYATCSVLKRENEGQVQDFLSSHDDAIELPINGYNWGIQQNVGRQVLTGDSSMDGFYYARIVKK